MFGRQTLYRLIESLTPSQRAALMNCKSIAVIKGIRKLHTPSDPVRTIAAYIVGSTVSDGGICEKDYLFIFPSLIKALGNECDIAEIKRAYKVSSDVQEEVESNLGAMHDIFRAAGEELKSDIVCLCLLIMAENGKLSPKERHYIERLV